jgi:hypothetical protein
MFERWRKIGIPNCFITRSSTLRYVYCLKGLGLALTLMLDHCCFQGGRAIAILAEWHSVSHWPPSFCMNDKIKLSYWDWPPTGMICSDWSCGKKTSTPKQHSPWFYDALQHQNHVVSWILIFFFHFPRGPSWPTWMHILSFILVSWWIIGKQSKAKLMGLDVQRSTKVIGSQSLREHSEKS